MNTIKGWALEHGLHLLLSAGVLAPLVYWLTQQAKNLDQRIDALPPIVKQAITGLEAAMLNAAAAYIPGLFNAGDPPDITHIGWSAVLTWAIAMAIHGQRSGMPVATKNVTW